MADRSVHHLERAGFIAEEDHVALECEAADAGPQFRPWPAERAREGRQLAALLPERIHKAFPIVRFLLWRVMCLKMSLRSSCAERR